MHNRSNFSEGPVRHILLLPRGTEDGTYGVYAMDCSSYFQGESGPATGEPCEVIIDPQITYSLLKGTLERIEDVGNRPPSNRTFVLMLKELKEIAPFDFQRSKNLFAVEDCFWENILKDLKEIGRSGKSSRVRLIAGMNIDNKLLV